MQIDPTTLSVLGVILVSSFIRSAFGFGDALISMPILVMLLGLKTATPLVALISSTIALAILVKSWRSMDVKSAWRLVISSLVGIPIGLYFLKGSYEIPLRLILAGVLIGFSLFLIIEPKLLAVRGKKSALFFGFIGGILGGAYNTNGPPIIIYGALRRWDPAVFRSTLQGYFFPTGLMVLIGHGLSGLWTRTVFHHYLLVLPIIILNIILGHLFYQRIPKERFNMMMHLLLLTVGILLLINTILLMISKG